MNTTTYEIYHAEKGYTLWGRTENNKLFYQKYLGKDFDKIKAEYPNVEYKGEKKSTVEYKTSEYPEDTISFGKHKGKKWSDLELYYLQWLDNKINEDFDTNYESFFGKRPRFGFSKRYDAFKKALDEKIFAKSEEDAIKKEEAKKEEKPSQDENYKGGHFYEDGKRIDIYVTQKRTFHYSTMYGIQTLTIYEDSEGNELVGQGDESDFSRLVDYGIDRSKPVLIKATVFHNEYKGKKQTRLKRIVLSKKFIEENRTM